MTGVANQSAVRTFINHDKTVLITVWPNGTADVAVRPSKSYLWGSPVRCIEEKGDDPMDR